MKEPEDTSSRPLLSAGAGEGPKSFFSQARHDRVLASGRDIPEERPSFAIHLNAVGISAKTVWVGLPQGRLSFDLRLEVDLRAERRGIHMSRLEEAITQLHGHDFVDLRDYALELVNLVIPAQDARWGRVELIGKLPRFSQTGISGRVSLDSLNVRVEVETERIGSKWRQIVGLEVGVNHITACPCTQVYNLLLLSAAETSTPDDQEVLMPTHSQRSHTRLAVFSQQGMVGSKAPGHETLLACLASALHLSQDLLKRPDEAELVYAAHRYPQFAEDAVRETARAAGKILGPLLPSGSRILIRTVGLESIHSHDVHCRLDTTLATIRPMIKITKLKR